MPSPWPATSATVLASMTESSSSHRSSVSNAKSKNTDARRSTPTDDVEHEVAAAGVVGDLPAEPREEADLAHEVEHALVAPVDGDGRAPGRVGGDDEAGHLPRRRGEVGGVRPEVVLDRGLGGDPGLAVVALARWRLDEALGHRDPLERAPGDRHLVVARAPLGDARDLLDEEHEVALVGQVQEAVLRELARPQPASG